MLQRKAQTSVIGDMLREEAELKSRRGDDRKVRQALSLQAPYGSLGAERPLFAEAIMAALRTKYGMKADQRDPFDGLTFDPHLQCPRDPDHLLWFGIAKTLLEFAYDTFTEAMKESVSRRLLDFAWPSNYSRITFDLSRTIASRYSMAFVRKMFLLAVLTWDDLLSPELFQLFSWFYRITSGLLARSRTELERQQLEALTIQFVDQAGKVLGEVTQRPNWHNLLELVKKDLRLYPNLNLVRTSAFEAHHQGLLSTCILAISHAYCTACDGLAGPKSAMQHSRHLNPEPFALRCDERMDALRYALHRGPLLDGQGNVRVMGGGIVGMTDPRRGLEHLPHPLLRAISSHMRPLTCRQLNPASLDAADCKDGLLRRAPSVFVRNGDWFPARYDWDGSVLRTASLDEKEMRVLRDALRRDFPEQRALFSDDQPLTVVSPASLIDRTGPRSRRLQLGDDVCIRSLDSKESQPIVARIAKLLVVCIGKFHVPYLVPQYFERFLEPCPDRDLPVVCQWANNRIDYMIPVPVDHIMDQVMVVHLCKRICTRHKETKQAFSCGCDAVCGIRAVCDAHSASNCKDSVCLSNRARWQLRDCHSTTQRNYLVVDRSRGFIAEARRQVGVAED
jgi:hypothetical protein